MPRLVAYRGTVSVVLYVARRTCVLRPLPPLPMYDRSSTATSRMPWYSREVEGEREPVHAAADDHDVVARLQVAPREELPSLEQPAHDRAPPPRRRGCASSAWAESIAGTKIVTPAAHDQHFRRGPRHLALDPALRRQLELGEPGERVGCVGTLEHQRRPRRRRRRRPRRAGLGRRWHARESPVPTSITSRGATRTSVRPSPGLDRVAYLARCEHGDDRGQLDPQLSHASAHLRGRRTGSARPTPSRPARLEPLGERRRRRRAASPGRSRGRARSSARPR